MALVADRCICLRRTEYSETSQVLVLLGREHGIVHVIAKGAHRTTKAGASRFGGGVDLLDLGDAVFTDRTDKDLGTLTEWKLTEGHLDLRRNLRGLWLALAAAEMTGLLFEQKDAQPLIFDQLITTIAELATPRREQAFTGYALALLRESGFLPELGRCVACGQPAPTQGRVSFDAEQAGILCRNCEGAYSRRTSLDARLLGIAQYLLKLMEQKTPIRRWPQLTRTQTDPINRLIMRHTQHVLTRRLLMAQWIGDAEDRQ